MLYDDVESSQERNSFLHPVHFQGDEEMKNEYEVLSRKRIVRVFLSSTFTDNQLLSEEIVSTDRVTLEASYGDKVMKY
jgi:hypothetical protein